MSLLWPTSISSIVVSIAVCAHPWKGRGNSHGGLFMKDGASFPMAGVISNNGGGFKQ